jgi:hypothetical protein
VNLPRLTGFAVGGELALLFAAAWLLAEDNNLGVSQPLRTIDTDLEIWPSYIGTNIVLMG